MKFRRYLSVGLLLLTIPLMGFGSRVSTGCGSARGGCGGPSGEGDEVDGGVAKSNSYGIGRTELGSTLTTVTSSSNTYQATTTLGNPISQTTNLSDTYKSYHPLSRDVLSNSDTLNAKIEAFKEKKQKKE